MILHLEELLYGEVVPAVTCPECGGELIYTDNGAFCDWDQSYVPRVDTRVVVIDDETDWNDDASDDDGA